MAQLDHPIEVRVDLHDTTALIRAIDAFALAQKRSETMGGIAAGLSLGAAVVSWTSAASWLVVSILMGASLLFAGLAMLLERTTIARARDVREQFREAATVERVTPRSIERARRAAVSDAGGYAPPRSAEVPDLPRPRTIPPPEGK